ncbi:unnamed protein product [Musa hybrid cultivar]
MAVPILQATKRSSQHNACMLFTSCALHRMSGMAVLHAPSAEHNGHSSHVSSPRPPLATLIPSSASLMTRLPLPALTADHFSVPPATMMMTLLSLKQQLKPATLVFTLPSFLSSVDVLPQHNTLPNGRKRAYLSVKLSQQQATDLILVASPNGPHLRLLKQSMTLVVFSLRPMDRLAIVTYSTTATRAFPLRRMSSQGKRAALQVIDRIFYLGEAEPAEGLRKGLKILEDRTHHNPLACILHLSDSPTQSYVCRDLQFPIPIHRFHIGFGFGMSSGFVMHEFEEFLARLLGGMIRETQVRIGAEGGRVLLGELRGGEERRIPVNSIDDCGYLAVSYSYVEGGAEQRLSTGEVVLGTEMKNDQNDPQGEIEATDLTVRGRSNHVERWGYLDPFMARRWAKHLHGHKA